MIMKHIKEYTEFLTEAAFKGQDAYEDAYEWIKYSLNIPHAKEIIGKLKRRFKSKPFSEDDVRQIMSESVNEAKSVTQKEIEKLLGAKGIELKYDYTFDWDNLNFHNNKSAAKKAKSILDRKGIGTGAVEYLFGSNYLKVNDLKSE